MRGSGVVDGGGESPQPHFPRGLGVLGGDAGDRMVDPPGHRRRERHAGDDPLHPDPRGRRRRGGRVGDGGGRRRAPRDLAARRGTGDTGWLGRGVCAELNAAIVDHGASAISASVF